MKMHTKTANTADTEKSAGLPLALFVWREMRTVGGVTVFIRDCMAGLPRYGWRVHLLCTARPLPGESPEPGISYLGCGKDASRWLSRRRIRRLVREARPELIVFNESVAAHDVYSLLAEPLPAVNIMHNCRPDRFYYENAGKLVQRGWATACVSSQTRLGLLDALGEPPKGVVKTLHLGIDPRVSAGHEKPAGTRIRLAYVGRLEENQKNAMALVDLTAALKRRNIPFELTIAGDGPSAGMLRERLTNLISAGIVHWRGFVSHADALEIFLQSDIYVLTSHYEGLPLAMLEAMARGCIPLVPDIPCGISDVVHDGVDGFVYPFGDYDEAAAHAARLSADGMLLESVQSSARKRAASFNINSTLANYAQYFTETVASFREECC